MHTPAGQLGCSEVVLVMGRSSGIAPAGTRHLAACGRRVFGASRAVAAILEKTGRLDAVVNNAGWPPMGPVEDTSIAGGRAQMETSSLGVLRVCRAARPVMRERRSGHIVDISLLGGLFGMLFAEVYNASKFAAEGLSESSRLDTAALGVL